MGPDQRKAQHQSAIVSVLGTVAPILHGEIQNLSEGDTQVWLEQPLAYASLVSINYNDNLLLGEVVYCQKEEAGWLVGIRVEHALLGVKALARAKGASG